MIPIRSQSVRRVLAVFITIATLATLFLGLRSYVSFVLLQSAYAAGEPKVADLRPWMTLGYIANVHEVDEGALVRRLGLPPETDPETAVLATVADGQGLSRFEYLEEVQRAVVEVRPATAPGQPDVATGWLGKVGDDLVGAMLVHGYLVLGLVLLVGAIGLPVPTGLSTVVAGSLATQEGMSWAAAAAVAVTASVVGDVIGYALGEILSRTFLDRHGHWLGYTALRRARLERMFHRWGGATVFLSRTLVSHLSSAINLLMGASRYRLYRFVLLTISGRLLWTFAYLGLGYGIGTDLEAAADFLKDVSLFLVSGGILAVLVWVMIEETTSARRPA